MLSQRMELIVGGISGTGELANLLALATSGDLTVSSNTSWANTADAFYRARYHNLTVNSGYTLTLANRGVMSVLVDGNLTLQANAVISMSQRGAIGTGAAVVYTFNGSHTQTIAYATGANGGAATTGGASSGNSGSSGTAGQSGGGGAGADNTPGTNTTGRGGNGTSFSGGSGGGGAYWANGNAGSDTGGPGGSGAYGGDGSYGGGGGAGNPGGAPAPTSGGQNGIIATAGGTGTAGSLIIFVMGNVSIASGGQIISAGSNGGNGWGGGGGSGGGIVYLAYNGSYSNSGTISCPGGNGAGYYSGGNGGAGSARAVNLNTLS